MPIVFGERLPMAPLVVAKVSAEDFARLASIDRPYNLYSNGFAEMSGLINCQECSVECDDGCDLFPYGQWLEYRRRTQSSVLPNDPRIGRGDEDDSQVMG